MTHGRRSRMKHGLAPERAPRPDGRCMAGVSHGATINVTPMLLFWCMRRGRRFAARPILSCTRLPLPRLARPLTPFRMISARVQATNTATTSLAPPIITTAFAMMYLGPLEISGDTPLPCVAGYSFYSYSSLWYFASAAGKT